MNWDHIKTMPPMYPADMVRDLIKPERRVEHECGADESYIEETVQRILQMGEQSKQDV